MKTKWKIMVVLAGLAVVTASAGEPSSVEKIVSAMRAGTYSEEYGRYTFPQLGTNDIAELLVHAGNTNILKSFPVNVVSSIGRMTTSEGMIALWLIEGVRMGGKFPSLIPVCYDRDKKVLHDALFYAEADQDAVYKAYLLWWEKTKGQKKEIDPLDGTALTWFGGRSPKEEK
jgi:hypothetical protein